MEALPEVLQSARLKLTRKDQRPYLASILYSLQPVPTPGIKTFAVDKYFRWYYDPALTDKWTVDECMVALQHECYHLMRKHAERAEDMHIGMENNECWNIAADCEINDDLMSEGRKFAKGYGVIPSMYQWPNDLMAEEYYKMIPEDKNNISADGDSKDGDGKEAKPTAGKCGSASGSKQEWEHAAPGGKNKDGSESAPGKSQFEGDLIRHKVAVDIEKSISQGNVPDYLKRWAKDILHPTVNWKKELQFAINHAVAYAEGKTDYSYNKPSRRQGMTKVILPSLRKPKINAAVVIDTSGSIGDTAISKAMAEINGVLKHVDSLDTIVCDAYVHSHKRITNIKQIALTGGGGTDMVAGINAAIKAKIKPHIVIVLTDGYTPWPVAPYAGTKLIAVLIGTLVKVAPKFIKTIKVND